MAEVELPELPDKIAERCAALGYTEDKTPAEHGWDDESIRAPGYTLLFTEKASEESPIQKEIKSLLNSITSANPEKKQELIDKIIGKFHTKAHGHVRQALGELNLESWRDVANSYYKTLTKADRVGYDYFGDADWYIKNMMIPKIDGIFSVRNGSDGTDYCSSTPVPAGMGGRRRRKRKTKRKTKRKKRKTKRRKSKRRKSRKSKKTKRRRRRRK